MPNTVIAELPLQNDTSSQGICNPKRQLIIIFKRKCVQEEAVRGSLIHNHRKMWTSSCDFSYRNRV